MNQVHNPSMRVTFLGTGTSMGVPVAGGFGAELIDDDPRNQRTRCSVWVQTDHTSLVIDTGPEFRIQTIRSSVKQLDLVLITHEHMDHIAGLDDVRAYNYAQNESIPLYASEPVLQSIKSRFNYMFGPDKYPGSASLELNSINGAFTFRDLTITPLPYLHGAITVHGFRIDDFSYLTDVKKIPDSTKELIKGSKVVVLSGLRWGPKHPTHLTIPEAVEIATELNAPQTFLTHMNSYVNHKETNNRLPDNIRLAYDELAIDL